MTKEKLEKEAEEYSYKVEPFTEIGIFNPIEVYYITDIEDAYLAGAEPREKKIKELEAQLESERDLPAIAYMQGAENQKKKADKQLTYAKTIIQDLLDNTDEYARQRAEDFLKEDK